MTPLAPTLERFFTERLIGQRRASPNTITSYRDTFRLLLGFAHHHTGKTPSDLDLVDLNATLIAAFLDHLEQVRHNSGHPGQENRPATRVVPHQHRNNRAYRRTRPDHLDRAP